MYLSNRNWHESPTELKLNPHPYLIVFATQYLCYTIIINEVTFVTLLVSNEDRLSVIRLLQL